MVMLTDDFYTILGISGDATPEEIRAAYRQAARRLHPDAGDVQGVTQFLKVQEAYETLSDLERRSSYDHTLGEAYSRLAVQPHMFYSRSSLAPSAEPQLMYVLLDFHAAQAAMAQAASSANFCLVLDRSTSMQGERMDQVKAAAIEFVRQLRPEDSLSIVTFSDRAEVLVSAEAKIDRKTAEARIHRIQTGGGTEMFQGLAAGLSELRRCKGHSVINNLILLTDGCTYGDERVCLELADRAAEQGVRINGLGIGCEWNDTFLDDLSTRTGGNSAYISAPGEVKQFFQERLNNRSQVYAERCLLNIRPAPGVDLSYVFRQRPDPASLDPHMPIRLGWIPKDNGASVLLEIVVPPLAASQSQALLLEGELSFVLASNPGAMNKVPLRISRPVVHSMSEEAPPAAVLQALSQVTLYRMQERVRREVSEGKIEDAGLRLRRLAAQLFNFGQNQLAQAVLNESEHIRQTHMLSERGEKHIKYGTRALLLPALTRKQSNFLINPVQFAG